MFAEALRGLLDLLSPPCCPACALPVSSFDVGFCGACRPLLEPFDDPRRAHGAYHYAGPLADAVRRWKYGDERSIAAHLAPLLVDACRGLSGEVDVVVPVPMHPDKLRSRGFSPAAQLGAAVASSLGVPLDVGCLRRVRDDPPQAGQPGAARARHVRGAFLARRAPRAVTSRVRASSEPPRVLVIDDVRTTGATLDEVASALCGAGASRVVVMALAATPAR